MVYDGPRIPSSSIPGGGVLPLRPRTRDDVHEEEPRFAPLKKRGRFDPKNIEIALRRLAELLSLDIGGPRHDVMPRGFYLDILV